MHLRVAAAARHLPILLAWCAEGRVPLRDLVGRRIGLDELADAFGDPPEEASGRS